MSTAACTFAALARLDRNDLDAVQAMLDSCIGILLDVKLWALATGLTLACAAIGAAIGYVKGRWLAGLVWGAALGPIGWVVAVLMRSGLVECPECAARNQPHARRCRRCGVDIATAASRTARSEMRRADGSLSG